MSHWMIPKCFHEIVSWWRHQMETFSALLALCAGNLPVTGESPSQRPVTRSFDVSLICAWTNGLVNNCDAGDLRRHHAHHDVIVMFLLSPELQILFNHGMYCIHFSGIYVLPDLIIWFKKNVLTDSSLVTHYLNQYWFIHSCSVRDTPKEISI